MSRSSTSWLAIRQGYPTAECFQIGQKCLKYFSPGFRSMFGYFGIALKTFCLFGCLRGTLVVTRVFGGFFVSSECVSYTLRGTLVVTRVFGGFCVSSECVSYTLMDPVEIKA